MDGILPLKADYYPVLGQLMNEMNLAGVINRVINIPDSQANMIHSDTTSKSFYGAYDNKIDAVDVPNITYGHPKDHRPDLKQIVFGIGTTLDGVPIIGEVASGNESDMTLNGRWITKLRKMLKKDKDDFLLYIGDSALVTTNNLDYLDDEHMDFISRLPGRFDIEKELKKKANLENDWEDIGKISDKKNAASYKVWDTTGEIEGRTYRFVVVYSDHKDTRKLKALNKEYKKKMKHFEELSKIPFACVKDAEIEVKNYQKNHSPKPYRQIIE